MALLLFIAGNFIVGVVLSSFARNQLQAMQMTMFYFLPNMMLSGFMFPFAGMPGWTQAIGSLLPLTHFNRAVRGILLKGNGWSELWPQIWPVAVLVREGVCGGWWLAVGRMISMNLLFSSS